MDILIQNGRVINPAEGVDKIMDLYIENGIIQAMGEGLGIQAGRVIDAGGLWVTPGLIDLHVHLRDPGLTHKEDIHSGSGAAALGGFTTICAMPNTKPAMDSAALVKETARRFAKESLIDILLIGAATVGQKGVELTDVTALKDAGACAISEDGFSVMDAKLVEDAFKKCAEHHLPMFSHCEDLALVDGGVVNAGEAAERLGLPGISNASEEVIVARDIILSAAAGARLHLCHMSTAGSINIIRAAKALGAQVTAEACPHHFTLCDEDIKADDGNYKMNPPLRKRTDMEAVIAGLKEGVIDIIATDHAPHAPGEKAGGFRQAANGIVGLETALGISITELVDKNILTPMELIEKMSYKPAEILGIKAGRLSIGYPADIAVIDADTVYRIDAAGFHSKGKNTPFHDREVKGRAKYVLKNGKVIVDDGNLTI